MKLTAGAGASVVNSQRSIIMKPTQINYEADKKIKVNGNNNNGAGSVYQSSQPPPPIILVKRQGVNQARGISGHPTSKELPSSQHKVISDNDDYIARSSS